MLPGQRLFTSPSTSAPTGQVAEPAGRANLAPRGGDRLAKACASQASECVRWRPAGRSMFGTAPVRPRPGAKPRPYTLSWRSPATAGITRSARARIWAADEPESRPDTLCRRVDALIAAVASKRRRPRRALLKARSSPGRGAVKDQSAADRRRRAGLTRRRGLHLRGNRADRSGQRCRPQPAQAGRNSPTTLTKPRQHGSPRLTTAPLVAAPTKARSLFRARSAPIG